ncbi:MAG: sulfatase family protein [Nocardioidaceae bacterium]
MSRLTGWLALAALMGCLGLASVSIPTQPPVDRANVILILTDDMRLDDLAYMPHVQELLVDRGVVFEQALSTYPLCCPARATLLTGQYAHNHDVEGNKWPRGGFRRLNDDNTLATWLQGSDYRTAFIGKYLNEYPQTDAEYVPPGWDYWRGSAGGTYEYFNLTTNDDGTLVEHPGIHQSLVVEQYADEAITTYARSQEPFFLWASFVAPHRECEPEHIRLTGAETCWGPPSPTPMDEGAFDGVPLPESPAVNEQDLSDKTELLRRHGLVDTAMVDHLRRARLESLQSVDRAVAALVRQLKATGAWDETYVIFASDNGNALGEHRWVQKQLPYEEMIRVPLVMTGPGVPAGVTRSQSVTLADVSATALDVAGIEGGRVQDGESLLPLARGGVPDGEDRMILLEAGPRSGLGDGWLHQSVRTDRYTFIRWNSGFVELYDRDRDPYELDSVASDPAFADVRTYLEGALEDLVDCEGRECIRVYEGPDVAIR